MNCQYCGRVDCSHEGDVRSGKGNANPYQIGETIFVRAWWYPDKRVVRCRVAERSNPAWHKGEIFVTVEPLFLNGMTTGAHHRFINVAKDAVNPKALK